MTIASDGDGKYGIYTEELIKHLLLPNTKVEDVFKRVRIRVAHKTKNKQIPWESSSLMGDFYFSTKKIVPPASDFSLNDLTKEADEAEQIKRLWVRYLDDMKAAFREVQKFQERNVAKEKKIMALNKFLSAYDRNNPYSQEDNRIRGNARNQIEYWKNFRPKTVGTDAQFITIGSSKDDVLRIQGTPSDIKKYSHAEYWYYGYATITFKYNRVNEWSNDSNKLKVKME